jgi:hypothetical protein
MPKPTLFEFQDNLKYGDLILAIASWGATPAIFLGNKWNDDRFSEIDYISINDFDYSAHPKTFPNGPPTKKSWLSGFCRWRVYPFDKQYLLPNQRTNYELILKKMRNEHKTD